MAMAATKSAKKKSAEAMKSANEKLAEAMKSAKAKIAEANDAENFIKWYETLMKNTSEMCEEERRDHETHCNFIRGKLAD
ncbi:hypothetical protein A2U01_0050670, partial [Trifolium medium]|nr:hypothetical protein [Trifolium medium]